MIVTDVNVLVYSIVAGERSDEARRVFAAEPSWIAPSMLLYELLNILATWERKAIMAASDCQKTWRHAANVIAGNLVEPDPGAVLNLSSRHRITAYDAQYVQAAVERDLALVTEDRELLRKFPATAISIKDFLQASGTV